MDKNLKQLRENYSEKFGGLDIIFCGDFSQLEPINNSTDSESNMRPIYYASVHAKLLWHDAVDCFIELKVLHRFNQDKAWGNLLKHMREGNINKKDIELINKRVVKERNNTNLPENLKYAVHYNRTRDSIHTKKFEMIVENGEIDNNGIVKNCIIIAMDNIKFEDNNMMISSLGDFFKI